MEKYSFVLEFESKLKCVEYMLNLIPAGRCLRYVQYNHKSDVYFCDWVKRPDGSCYSVYNDEYLVEMEIYFMHKEDMKRNCSFKYPFCYRECVEGDDYKYFLHLEPPMVKPAFRPKD